MIIKEENEDGRIIWKFPPIPDGWGYHNPNFRSFVFLVKAWCVKTSQWKFYGGRHTLQSKWENWKEYKGSIGKGAKKDSTIKKAEEYKTLLATSPKVIFEVSEWTTLNNAGYGEADMLYDVKENELGSWFNSTKGQGGHGAQGLSATKRANDVYDRVRKLENIINELWNPKSHKYSKEIVLSCTEGEIETRLENTIKHLQKEYDDVFQLDFTTKKEIEIMLKNFLQVRAKPLESKKSNDFKYEMNLDSNPNRFGFSIQLRPDEKSKNGAQIGSGNHSGDACVKSDNGIGMWSIGIPYYIYKDWGKHIIKYFFSLFNPQFSLHETRTPHSPEDDAEVIVNFLKGEKIFVKDEKGNNVPDLNHNWVSDYFKKQKYPSNKKVLCIEACETIIDDERLQLEDDHLQTYSESDIKNDPALKRGFEEKTKGFLKTFPEKDSEGKTTGNIIKNPNGSYDSYVKVSMSTNIEAKVMDHFYANNYEDNFKFDDCGDIIGKLENYEKPKVLLLLHAKSIAKLKRWETSARTPKTDAITNNERLQKTIQFCSGFVDITIKILPLKRSDAISDGWIILESVS